MNPGSRSERSSDPSSGDRERPETLAGSVPIGPTGAVVRHALQRGYLSADSYQEALRLQREARAQGRSADLLAILKGRFLRPEHVPELSAVFRAASADSPPRPADVRRATSGRAPRPSSAPLTSSSQAGSRASARLPEGRSLGDTERAGVGGAEAPGPQGSIAGYRIVRELARGAFGIVYHAHSLKLDRPVALKLLRHADIATEEDLERFQIEARAAARLRHPNIVGIHDVGQEGERHYLVMDLIEGETLRAQIEREGPLDPQRVALLGERLCEALYYAHSNQILHRDLKPANILINLEGQPLLTDFGLAKDVREEGEGLTATGQAMGTPAYMPPEQAAGDLDRIDRRADVYSLGATLYEALSGRPPFQGATALVTMNAVVSEEAPRLRSLRPGLSLDLETVVHRCLEKEPEARYASANLLGDELRRIRAGEPTLARPLSPVGRLARWLKRNPLVSGSVVALALALGVGVVGAYFWKVGVAQERAKQEAARVAKIRGEVGALIDEVESGELTRNDEIQRVFYDLVRRTEPEALEVMLARLDSISDALAGVSKETYLEANVLTPEEREAGLEPVAGLEAALKALEELRPGDPIPSEVSAALAAAGNRISEREYSRYRVRVSSHRVSARELIAARQGRLAGRLSAARVLLFVLQRLHGAGIDDCVGRYLLVEADPARSIPAGQALARMKTARAKELLFWARDLYGTKSDFWRNLRAGRSEDLSGLQSGGEATLKSSASLLYQAEIDYERRSYADCRDQASEAIELEPESVRAWVLRARAHWALKDYRGALDDSKQVVQLDPERAYGWIVQGQCLANLGYKDESLAVLDEAVSKNPTKDWAYRERAGILRDQGNLERALGDVNRAVELGPQDWRNWEGRGQVNLALRRLQAAEKDYLEAVRLDQNFYQSWQNLSTLRWELGKYKLALGDSTRALRLAAGNARAEAKILSNRAVTYQSMGNFEAALLDLNEAITRSPKVADPWAKRGALRGMIGRYKEGIADLDEAIRLNPKQAEPWLNRGLLRAHLNATTTALDDIGMAIRLDPKFARAYTQRAEIYSTLGRIKEAGEDFTRAIKLRPNDDAVWFMLGVFFDRHNGPERALEAYNRALSLAPQRVRVYRRRGQLYRRQGKVKEALADYTQALEVDPSEAEVRNLRAHLYASEGEFTKAIADYSIAIRADPKNHILWISRAAVYHHTGEVKSAQADLEHAASVAGQSWEMWQERALLEIRWGEVESARTSVGRAIALGAGEKPRLYVLRGELREAAGDYAGAIEDFERFLRLRPDPESSSELRNKIQSLRDKIPK